MTPVVMNDPTEWPKVVRAVRLRSGDQPDWKCLAGYYNVCITSIMSPEIAALWRMYVRSGRGRNETCESYLEMPAIVADAFEVLDDETRKIELDFEEKNRRQLASEIEKARRPKGYGRR